MDKVRLTPVASLNIPLGGQRIDLEQVDYEVAGAMRLLRIRIREGKRFTIFDIDPLSAGELGRALTQWADGAVRGPDGDVRGPDGEGAGV